LAWNSFIVIGFMFVILLPVHHQLVVRLATDKFDLNHRIRFQYIIQHSKLADTQFIFGDRVGRSRFNAFDNAFG
jgi:hypothetical protein